MAQLSATCLPALARSLLRLAFAAAALPCVSCDSRPTAHDTPAPPPSSEPAASLSTPHPPVASAAPKLDRGPVVLLAGGDVDLSRRTGQRILRDPALHPLRAMQPLFSTADLRFANLESQLCDLGGSTGSPDRPLVFAGPPAGAAVLQRSRFDIVSTANNHAWDYGRRCLTETTQLLREAGIEAVGTDPDGKDPLRPAILERKGRKLALFAMTAIFNDGPLPKHAAAPFIAYADIGALARRISTLRKQVDWIVVSLHIGEEYMHEPVAANRAVLAAAIDAGADIVLGHHPHTPQRVEFHKGKPIAFSLGNLVFHQNSAHPWTGWGVLARVTLQDGLAPSLEICPYHMLDAAPNPLDPKQEAAFLQHWDAISKGPAVAVRGARSHDGCHVMQQR